MTPSLAHLLQTFMLHRLVDLGLDDSELADRLRDEMDVTGRALSKELSDQVNAVGARLNAERDLKVAVTTERIEELDRLLQHLARQKT
jgi:hypothetical protein